MIEACLQVFDQLRRRFFYKDQTKTPKLEDKNFVIAACRSWFDEYRGGLLSLGINEPLLVEIDKPMKNLLQATNSSKRRSYYRRQIKKANTVIDGLQVDAQIAEWNISKEEDGDVIVRNALKILDSDLERRYLQVIYDLNDPKRVSYAGTANEIREIIRIVLFLQAPDAEITKTPWFRKRKENEEKNNKTLTTPTQTERVKFIMEKKRAGDKALKNAQENEALIEGLLGKVVRSSYDRMNAGVHGQKNRDEIIKGLRYVHAFLLDILPE